MNKKDAYLAHSLGVPVYYVGGCVRDWLLGIEPKDFDLCCELSTNEVYDKLRGTTFDCSTIEGASFLVSSITILRDVPSYEYHRELSQFRIDKGDHAVGARNMEEDSLRRDFTINALYRDVKSGKVFDPTENGLSDIIDKKIRFIGDPEKRIKEDPLRIYRGYRLASKLKPYGFNIESKTLKAMREFFNFATTTVPPERIRIEIEKIIFHGGIEK